MKILFCDKCYDVRKLLNDTTCCKCGLVKGRYVDNINAEWNGVGFVLGFSNYSLVPALRTQREIGDRSDGLGRTFEAFIIPESAPTVKLNRNL